MLCCWLTSILVVQASSALCCTGQSTLKAKLARSGHAALVVGLNVVITGGILRDGSLIVDVVVIDLATVSVIRCACQMCTCHPCRNFAVSAVQDHTP